MPISERIPSASVVIATSNRADSLKRALESLCKVDYPEGTLEIIVIDDGSEDHTRDVVDSLVALFSPVPLLYHFLPKGNITHARNKGVETASGDIIVFTDDDCTFETHWLKKLLEPFADPKTGAVGGDDCAPAITTPFAHAVDYAFSSLLGVGGVRQGGKKQRLAHFYPRGCNMAVRKELVIDVGGFDSRFFNGEEIDLDYRIEKAGFRLCYQPGCTVQHHRRTSLKSLRRQVFGRGYSRSMLFKKHPDCFEPAYLLPSVALASGIMLLLLSPLFIWAACSLLICTGIYLSVIMAGAIHAAVSGRGRRSALSVPVVLGTMHLFYAAGFWCGLIRKLPREASPDPPLRCLISNDGFGANQGDRAILQVMRNDLNHTFPGVEINGFLNSWIPSPRRLFQFWRDLRKADIFLMGGGQILHDQTCLLFLFASLLKLIAARIAGTPFFCYGIGAGPIHSRIGRNAAGSVLKHAARIIVRDHASERLLIEIGVPGGLITVTADLAFRLPLPPPQERYELLTKLGLSHNTHPKVAICPRRWFHYSKRILPARWSLKKTDSRHENRFSGLIQILAETAEHIIAEGGEVWLIPMKISGGRHDPGQDDNIVCREINARISRPEKIRILNEDLIPEGISALLSEMDAVITMRMHAAILASIHGVPAVGIALSEKFSECFTQLQVPEQIIPVEQITRDKLLCLLDYTLDNSKKDRDNLRDRAKNLAGKAGENIACVRQWVEHSLNS